MKEKTDEEHRLTQLEIVDILQKQYDLTCDRRTVASSLDMLAEQLHYDINRDSDGYCLLGREFEDAELRMLIDSVICSKTLTKEQAKRLVKKIKGLGNEHFSKSVPEVEMVGGIGWSKNPRFLLNVNELNKAIHKRKQVEFSYMKYDEKLQLCSTGIKYLLNPYYLIVANGFYFLMGNYDKYDNVSYYRVDRIDKLRVLDTKAKDKKDVRGLVDIRELPRHLAEHIYMFSGKTIRVQIKTTKDMISDFVDWFGNKIEISPLKGEEIVITVRTNEHAIVYWLLQYGMYVEVLKPQVLRDKMKEVVLNLQKKYC
ncbi:MAG: WYL domain-containing protein [Acidaminococcaceae bacterium]|nr:WYL domain-containing protein [Acidaminococcaceae bacterium]